MAGPIILEFPFPSVSWPGAEADNTVNQFLTTAPGTAIGRCINFALTAEVGATYANLTGQRGAIYNPKDDRMYFIGIKTTTSPVASDLVLVKYNPRTLAIDSEVVVLAAASVTGIQYLMDVSDERAWVLTNGEVRAYDTTTLTLVFHDLGALAPLYYLPFAYSAGSGKLVMSDLSDISGLTIAIITVTGFSTFSAVQIVTPKIVLFQNDGSYRRKWIESLNKLVLIYVAEFPLNTTEQGLILDMVAETFTDIPTPAAWTNGGVIQDSGGPWWDPYSAVPKFVCTVGWSDGSNHYGIGVFDQDGILLRTIGTDTTDWDTASPPMPIGQDLLFAWSLGFFPLTSGAGGLDVEEATPTPVQDWEDTSLFVTSPDGLFFDQGIVCIAPIIPLSITTLASAGGPLGTAVTDTATLSGGFDESGAQLEFRLHFYIDDACGDVAYFETQDITGDGDYVSTPFVPLVPGTYCWVVNSVDNSSGDVWTECGDPDELVTIGGALTITTMASAGGAIGTALTDTATLSGFDSPTGTIVFTLYGPNDETCALSPCFTSDPVVVAGNDSYVSSPAYFPVADGTYRWRAAYSGDDNNDPFATACGDANEEVFISTPAPPQGGGASPGNCGVQFERLELFHLLKSLMGGGRTLKEALKFVDQDDIDFLEEEGYMDDLPLEIPKPMRQGASPKMVSTRVDLTPITKLNRLIDEFETKLQDCVHRSVGEYEK